MILKIVYDNEAREEFLGAWGFSCMVEHSGKKILFDTGWDANILLYNMDKFDINREDIDIIVISHYHWDHSGGLAQMLHPSVKVYVPVSFSKRMVEEIKKKCEVIEVAEQMEIIPDVYTTGALGTRTKEQSLSLRTKEGIVVLTGCAHPGLENILEGAKKLGELRGVIGGFHGFDKFGHLDRLSLIIPCHCTAHKEKIMESYPDVSTVGYAGKIIEI